MLLLTIYGILWLISTIPTLVFVLHFMVAHFNSISLFQVNILSPESAALDLPHDVALALGLELVKFPRGKLSVEELIDLLEIASLIRKCNYVSHRCEAEKM